MNMPDALEKLSSRLKLLAISNAALTVFASCALVLDVARRSWALACFEGVLLIGVAIMWRLYYHLYKQREELLRDSMGAPGIRYSYPSQSTEKTGIPTASPAAMPDVFGMRYWMWDIQNRELISPHMQTVWISPEHRCDEWIDSEAVQGVAGVHALLVPNGWRSPEVEAAVLGQSHARGIVAYIKVWGIVERFGRYVLGTEGWRAEWVVIRTLIAPTTEIGLSLEERFPEVEVIYGDR